MNANAVVLMQGLLERGRAQTQHQLSDADHKTYWVAEQYLKSTGMSPEEVIGGIVDGEKDCGLDAVYVFANGICLKDDTPLPALGKRARLELTLFQVKDSKGFGEEAIDKLIVNLPRLLQFDRNEQLLMSSANPRVIETTRRFLDAYRTLDLPELQIYVVFASLRATHLHDNTVTKGQQLREICASLFGDCPVHITFLDAGALYEMARESQETSRTLQLSENPISTDTAGGYIGVAKLSAYQQFISTSEGELDTSLFEANVRDYEGEVAVNQSIEKTLAVEDPDVDFWWLNNGVTIVASEVQPANKLLKLTSPQIVNGLQTSTEIYKRGRVSDTSDDNRSVLVKIIQANDPAVRERIIRATNSQTSFGPSALRSTDKVQRQIEDYLLTKDFYYERRRRQYYNEGRPMDRIISIDGMGQALLSSLVQVPHIARATPSRVFDSDIYDLAFSVDFSIQTFAAATHVLRQCDEFLRSARASSPEDFRFHLAMLAAIAATRKLKPTTQDLAKLEDVTLQPALLGAQYELLRTHYDLEAKRTSIYLLDLIAKNEKVTRGLLSEAGKRLRGPSNQVVRRPRASY
jgi:hypothetical protein